MKFVLLSLISTAFTHTIELAHPLPDFTQDLEHSLTATESTPKNAATILKALKSLNSNNFGNICELVDVKPDSLFSAYNAHNLAGIAGCQKEIHIDSEKVLKYARTAGVDSNIPNLFYAVSLLRRKNKLGKTTARNHILDNLANAYEKSPKSLVDAAFTMLAAIEVGGAKLSKFVTLKNRVGLAVKVISSGVQYDSNRLVLEGGELEAASLAIRAFVATNKAMSNSKIQQQNSEGSGNIIVMLANGLLLSTPETSVEKAHVVQALSALNADTTGLAKPVSLKRTLNYPHLEMLMTDVFGKPVTSAQFSIGMNNQVEAVDSTGKIDMSVFELKTGVHSYEVTIPGGSNVYCGVKSGKHFSMKVPSAETSDIQKIALKIQKKGKKKTEDIESRTLTTEDSLAISFQISGEPHQIMIRFSKDDVEGFVLMQHKQDGFYAALIDIKTSSKSVFKRTSGIWSIEAIIGNFGTGAIIQNIGKIKIDLEVDSIEKVNQFDVLKTIQHVFPEADSRPHEVISNIFTMLTLIPLVLLFITWRIIGLNFKLFNLSIWSSVFHVSVMSVFGLYICYWIGYVNMFLTVRYLSIIGSVLMISGNKHLNHLAIRRMTTDGYKQD